MKTCAICKISKDDSSFRMVNRKGYKYLHSYCHQCNRDYHNNLRKSKAPPPKPKYVIPEELTCIGCKIKKPKSDFYTVKTKHNNYLLTRCRNCQRKQRELYARQKGVLPMKCRPLEELPKNKSCTKCGIIKKQEEYRIRSEKRKTGTSYWLNPSCLECDRIFQRNRWKSQRATEEGRKRHNEWAKNYAKRNKEKLKIKTKEYREKVSAKENRRRYIEENKEKLRKQEYPNKIKYHVKNRDTISDQYIKNLLRNNKGIFDPTPEQIEIHRNKVLIDRIKRHIHLNKKKQNEGHNRTQKALV